MTYLHRVLGINAAGLAPARGLEPLEPRALLAADLSISASNVSNFFDKATSADRIELSVAVTNVGDQTFRASGNVEFYLSTDGTFDSGDALFATLKLPSIILHDRKVLNLSVPEPKDVNPPDGRRALPAGSYTVIARLSGVDANPDNDVAAASGTVDVNYEFGTGEGGVRVSLTIPLPDGTNVTFRINGTGSGSVRNDNGRTIVTLNAGGAGSELFITTDAKAGQTSIINGLVINDVFDRIVADRIVVDGHVIINGGVSFFSIAGLTNGSLYYAATGFGFFLFQSTEFSLGAVRDSILSTDVPIRSLSVSGWVDTNGWGDLVSAPSAISITSAGDFQPSLALTSRNANDPYSLSEADIAGKVSGSWRLASGSRRLQVGSVTPDFIASIGGAVNDFFVEGKVEGLFAAPTINHIFVGGDIRGGTILGGAQLGNDALPGGTGAAADSFAASTIADVTVRGSVINSVIAAGLSSTDNKFLNADDTFATGSSRIGQIVIYQDLVNSYFVAPSLPDTVRVRFETALMTANNRAFVSLLPFTP